MKRGFYLLLYAGLLGLAVSEVVAGLDLVMAAERMQTGTSGQNIKIPVLWTHMAEALDRTCPSGDAAMPLVLFRMDSVVAASHAGWVERQIAEARVPVRIEFTVRGAPVETARILFYLEKRERCLRMEAISIREHDPASAVISVKGRLP